MFDLACLSCVKNDNVDKLDCEYEIAICLNPQPRIVFNVLLLIVRNPSWEYVHAYKVVIWLKN